MKPTIIILGPQGSGKSTQAEALASSLNLNLISTGNIVHETIEKGTKFGEELLGYIGDGGLIPDKILIEKILLPKLINHNIKNGIVFEGVPRNIYQTKFLENELERNKILLPWLIYINIAKKTTYSRLATRKICPDCGTNYKPSHQEYQKNICSKCHKKLIIREDDQDRRAIDKRLSLYHKQTEPVIDYYKKKGRVVKINGEQSIQKVHKRILEKVKILKYD